MPTDHTQGEVTPPIDEVVRVSPLALPPLQPLQPLQTRAARPDGAASDTTEGDFSRVLNVPVELTAEMGRLRMAAKNILQLGVGSVVELETTAGEPMDVLVNGYPIAQGEVVVTNDRFGIRLTDVISPSQRLRRLIDS